MNRLLFIFSSLLVLLIARGAPAAVPNTHFVLARTVANHGEGSYVITQEVTLKQPEATFVITEKLYVIDGSEVLVVATGNEGFKLWKLFKKGREYWLDGGTERADPVSVDNPFPIFFTRSLTDFKIRLNRLKILPNEATREPKTPNDLKDINYEPEPWMRLGRVTGAIAFHIGEFAPPGDDPLPPGIWIEQDIFVVRKFRASPDAETIGNEPGEFSKSFWYPRKQIFNFGSNQVNVRVLRVQSLESFSSEIKKQFEPSFMRGRQAEVSTIWPKTPGVSVLQEFYKRFR